MQICRWVIKKYEGFELVSHLHRTKPVSSVHCAHKFRSSFLFLGTEASRVPEVTYIFNILIEKWEGIFIANENERCDGETDL
jgi:hypothetical protein